MVIVVAPWRSLHRNESLAAVGGHVGGGVDDVGAIGVGGIHGHGFEVPAAAPQPVLRVDQFPGGAGVVGNVDSAGPGGRSSTGPAPSAEAGGDTAAGIVHYRPDTVGIAGRHRPACLSDELVGGAPSRQLLPGIAATA